MKLRRTKLFHFWATLYNVALFRLGHLIFVKGLLTIQDVKYENSRLSTNDRNQ